jgi:glycolate oxidase iron-sulfur subunit
MDVKEKEDIRSTILTEVGKCRACRFCVDACALYQATEGIESMAPYGRIQILKYLLTGDLDEDDPLVYSLYSCLQCGRCDLVCQAKGQNLEVSELIRLGKYLLSHGLVKGNKNEKV